MIRHLRSLLFLVVLFGGLFAMPAAAQDGEPPVPTSEAPSGDEIANEPADDVDPEDDDAADAAWGVDVLPGAELFDDPEPVGDYGTEPIGNVAVSPTNHRSPTAGVSANPARPTPIDGSEDVGADDAAPDSVDEATMLSLEGFAPEEVDELLAEVDQPSAEDVGSSRNPAAAAPEAELGGPAADADSSPSRLAESTTAAVVEAATPRVPAVVTTGSSVTPTSPGYTLTIAAVLFATVCTVVASRRRS